MRPNPYNDTDESGVLSSRKRWLAVRQERFQARDDQFPNIVVHRSGDLGRILQFTTLVDFLPERDLVLLTSNPLDDISHVGTRVGVMKRGRWFSADELGAALARLAEERE